MGGRGKISVALVVIYLFALVMNTCVTLTCDCVSSHSRTTHSCKCEGCALLERNPQLMQHCECTHSHEVAVEVALIADAERSSKLIKIVVVELPRALAESLDSESTSEGESPTVVLSVPLEDDPLLLLGGLRAPPVVA